MEKYPRMIQDEHNIIIVQSEQSLPITIESDTPENAKKLIELLDQYMYSIKYGDKIVFIRY